MTPRLDSHKPALSRHPMKLWKLFLKDLALRREFLHAPHNIFKVRQLKIYLGMVTCASDPSSRGADAERCQIQGQPRIVS